MALAARECKATHSPSACVSAVTNGASAVAVAGVAFPWVRVGRTVVGAVGVAVRIGGQLLDNSDRSDSASPSSELAREKVK